MAGEVLQRPAICRHNSDPVFQVVQDSDGNDTGISSGKSQSRTSSSVSSTRSSSPTSTPTLLSLIDKIQVRFLTNS